MTTRRMYWSVGSLAAVAAIILASGWVLHVGAEVVKQGSSGPQAHRGLAQTDQNEKRCKASDLIGMDVRGQKGDDEIGSINDVVLGQNGDVKYVAVSFGGFLGMGDKLFAVPFQAIDFVKIDDDAYARIDVTEVTLKQKKGFDQDTWPSEADPSFTNGKLLRPAVTSGAAR